MQRNPNAATKAVDADHRHHYIDNLHILRISDFSRRHRLLKPGLREPAGICHYSVNGIYRRIWQHAAALPLLPGALRLALEGYVTGGSKRNRTYVADKVRVDPRVPQDLNEVA